MVSDDVTGRPTKTDNRAPGVVLRRQGDEDGTFVLAPDEAEDDGEQRLE